MRFRDSIPAVLLCLALFLNGCSSKPVSSEPRNAPATLESVRRYAQKALDGMSSSDDRQQAREAAVRSLVDLLKSSDSTRIAKADWERPVTQGNVPMVRVFELTKAKVFGFPLPGPGVVPPGERVLVQFDGTGGALHVVELPTMPGGQLTAAKTLAENNQISLAMAFTLVRGGGYVAHYQLDPRSGEFKPVPNAFKGLPLKVGDLTLEARDQFLSVNLPNPDDWRPQFDLKAPLRLFLSLDMALEWKSGKYTVLDERNFSAFEGFKTALDPKVAKTEREEAWEKATRKLPGYLQELASWNEDLTPKLPEGATFFRDQFANHGVRVVSVPAPEAGKEGFTVVQYRSGNGLPQAQAIAVPGKVEGMRLIARQGLPGVIIVSGDAGGQKGSLRKYVTLLRLTAGNDWAPAPDWFGWLPTVDGWQLKRTASQNSVEIVNTATPEAVTATLTAGADPGVHLCLAINACYVLSWVGDQLSGTSSLMGKLTALTAASTPPSRDQVLQVATEVQAFLVAPELQAITATQIAAALGSRVQVFEPAVGTRVVGLPSNGSGVVPAVVQGGKTVLIEVTAPHVVDRWTGAHVVQTGADTWLLVLGRGRFSAVLLLYKWDGTAWQPAAPLSAPVDRNIAERIRISYAPGQSNPVRGLYVGGGPEVSATFTPDGQGVAFCEGTRSCLTYIFDKQWVLR